LGGIDLTGGAGVVDIFTIGLQSDLAMNIEFDVYTDAGNVSRYSLTIAGNNVPVGYQLAFDDFFPLQGSGADFTNVGAVTMTVNTTGTQGDLDMLLFDFGLGCTSCQEPPSAGNDKIFTGVNEAVDFDVLSNDSDPNGATLSAVVQTQPTNGTVVQIGQQFLYTPNPNFVGTDVFTYLLTNATGNTDVGTVEINVSPCDNQVVIDLFETSSPFKLLTLTGSEFDASAGNGIIGGERDVETFMTVEDPNFNLLTVGDGQDGNFQYIEAGPVRGGFNITYDGTDNDPQTFDPTGLGGIDLTNAGSQGSLDFYLKSDLPTALLVNVYTDGGNMSSYTINIEGDFNNRHYTVDFSMFDVSIGTGADFTNVGSIVLRFDSSPFNGNRDIRLLCITTGCRTILPDYDQDGVFDINDPDDDNDGIPDWVEAGCISASTFGTTFCPDPAADQDGDGTPNYQDPDFCTLNAFGICADQDTDNDGTPDYFDIDSDNDCIPDYVEADNATPSGIDSDMDGIDDAHDVDQGGDGLNNLPTDTDSDGTPDYQELDADNDGLFDFAEANNSPASGIDTDMDGIDDVCDVDQGGPGLNKNPIDTDMDGTPDFRDEDSDDDGISDLEESMCPFPITSVVPCDAVDTDMAGHPDPLDLDSDNDGIPDEYECPTGTNCIDTDMDGTPDYLDIDSDGDGILDEIEAGCPRPYSSNVVCDPIDTDMDGDPDHLDLDADNDGLLDEEECPNYNGVVITCDENMDGTPDHLECQSANMFISGPSQICPGEDLSLSVVSVIPNATYVWRIAGSTQILQISSNPTFNGVIQNAVYEVSLVTNLCINEDVETFAVDVAEPIGITISSSNLDCLDGNSDVNLFSDITGGSGQGFNYLWSGPNGFSSFEQNPTIQNANASLNNGIYVLEITDNLGCQANASVQINISELPNTANIYNNNSYCEGEEIDLTTDVISGAQYFWYDEDPILNPGATVVYNGTSATINNLPSGTYDYYLVVTSNGCSSEPAQTTFTVDPIPTIVNVTGGTSYCEGEDVLISAQNNVPGTGNIQYTWTGPNGFVYTNTVASGEPFDLVIPSASPNQSGNYSLNISTNANCSANTVSTNLLVNAMPQTPDISVDKSFACEGQNLFLNVPSVQGNNVMYTWLIETQNNPPIQVLGTTTTPNYTVINVDQTKEGFYYCIVDANGCVSNPSNKVFVDIFDTPIEAIPSNTTTAVDPVCEGESFELSLPIIQDATYQWFGPNGFTSNQSNPLVNGVTTANAGEYYAIITYNDCYSSATTTTEVFVQEAVDQPTIIASGSVCESGTAILEVTSTINFPSGTPITFEWFDFETNELIGTTNSPTLTLSNLTPNQSGFYYLVMTVGNGACKSEPSAPALLEVFEIPTNEAYAGENISLCEANTIDLAAAVPSIGTGLWTTLVFVLMDQPMSI